MSRRTPVQLGAEVTRIREALGMTKAALARSSGVSNDALTNLEKGRFKKQPHTLPLVADALGVTVAALIFDDHPAETEYDVLRRSLSGLDRDNREYFLQVVDELHRDHARDFERVRKRIADSATD